MIIWPPTQKHLKMQRSYKFKSKVFLSAFKILDYSSNVSFHPFLLPVSKILHSCWILFWICTFFHVGLSIRNVSPTHWNSISSLKTIPITIHSIKSFLINFKLYLSFLWNPTVLFSSFVASITVYLKEMLCVLFSLTSSQKMKSSASYRKEVSLIPLCIISLTQVPEARKVFLNRYLLIWIYLTIHVRDECTEFQNSWK